MAEKNISKKYKTEQATAEAGTVLRQRGVGFQVRKFSWKQEEVDSKSTAKFDWVLWGTEKPYINNYPSYIEYLYASNTMAHRILDQKAQEIMGSGIVFVAENEAISKRAADYFERIGFDEELLEVMAYDMSIFNGCACRVVRNALGEVASLDSAKVAKIRVSKGTGFWMSKNWERLKPNGKPEDKYAKGYEPVFYPEFQAKLEVGSPEELAKHATSILYVKKHNPVSAGEFYPLPDAECATDELDQGILSAEYWRSYVENNYSSSAILLHPYDYENVAEPTENDNAALDRITKTIKQTHANTAKAGEVTIIYYDNGRVAKDGSPLSVPEFLKPVEERNDVKFIETHREAKQNSLTALGAFAPEYFGVQTAAGFSSKAETLIIAGELFYLKIVRPCQKKIESLGNKLLKAAGIEAKMQIQRAQSITMPLSREDFVAGLITKSEFRQQMGLPELMPDDPNDQSTTQAPTE